MIVLSRLIKCTVILMLLAAATSAQTYNWISSSQQNYWQERQLSLKTAGSESVDLTVGSLKKGIIFKDWGTCFNELGWDALNILPADQRKDIMKKLFSTTGDMRFTLGRFSMNANDYARNWYSCDEVAGDFSLKYFNIDRDKVSLIPYLKAAQLENPAMKFWISPWSPPSWMKINQSYAVKSDLKYNQLSSLSDFALFEGRAVKNEQVFPQQVTVNDYLIQDPRYLNAYANYFCKFIDAYKEQGIPISMVMYQNEAYSYTIYPGCAWTAEGSIRFNTNYLGPALKKNHPDVSLYLGTINTNRYEVVDQILSDQAMRNTIKGVGFQWEGGQILPAIRKKYPQYDYVQTESECGWGSFDWEAAEHTFGLINHYIGNGTSQYTFWNAILADQGVSGWGWKQNALIRVDSKNKTATLTPEYYAVKHYCRYVIPGSRLVGFKASGQDRKPILAFKTPEGKTVIIAGNFKNEIQQLTVKIGDQLISASLEPHSLHTFESR